MFGRLALRARSAREDRNRLRRSEAFAISFVQYLSGFRADLNAIGEICRRHRCFFFVDAIQGLGAFPLDVEAAHIDALAADGHKWLLGPEGCGILYVRTSRQDSIFPGGIRLDQRRGLQRLRLARHDAAAGCRTL